jgi:hypothetical protein
MEEYVSTIRIWNMSLMRRIGSAKRAIAFFSPIRNIADYSPIRTKPAPFLCHFAGSNHFLYYYLLTPELAWYRPKRRSPFFFRQLR